MGVAADSPSEVISRLRLQPLGDIDILNVDGGVVESRWPDFEIAMKAAFAGASFMEGFGPDSPLTHTRDGFAGPDRRKYRHVVALGARGEILGACFRVPTGGDNAATNADPGWFFVSSDVPVRARLKLADAIIDSMHLLLRRSGFTRIVTNMGTKSGALFLCRRHAYTHQPTSMNHNRWLRDLLKAGLDPPS